jgi:glycosyltransferase involved in cell wall biosynthesis
MLCGTPVVMTNTPGGRVPVQKTGMGLLSEKGDYKSIGNAIVEVLDNPTKYRKTYEEVEDTFSFKRTVDQYEQLFREYSVNGR